MKKHTNFDPVTQFENEVRTVIRRGSSAAEYEASTKEIAAHYSDVIQEQISRGATEQEAIVLARHRVGTPEGVALQILSTPGRITKGDRIQLWLQFALIITTCQALGFSILAMRSPNWGHFYGFYVESVGLHFATALIYGYGVFLSKRLLWKPLLLTTLVNFLGTAVALKAFESTLTNFSEYEKKSQLILSPTWFISSSYQMTLLNLATFLGAAMISYLIGRIWLLRTSWFRLLRG